MRKLWNTNRELKNIKKLLWPWCISGVLILLLSYFQWQLVEILTPFLMPFLWLGVFGFFIVIFIFSVIWLFKKKDWKPFGIQMITIVLLILIPFNQIVIDLDFKMNKSVRNKVISEIQEGKLIPNVSYNTELIHLPKEYASVSKGGGDVLIEKVNGHYYVFFFTFRGVLDNFSGFIYSPNDKKPQANLFDVDFKEVVKMKRNWYYVSSY